MTNSADSGIEFPCNYPIKVVVDAEEVIFEEVFSIARRHDPELDRSRVTSRPSRNGNYHSITLQFRATGEDQLQRLFEDLKECRAVRMVL